ncbi:MAG: glycosyltransferase family 39 protein [Candidatus Ratteibacteria bacterium]
MKKKLVFIFVSFFLTVFFRVPYIFPYFSNVDEPEYALCGYKLLKNRMIYKEIFENKGFGLGYIYLFFMKIFKTNYLFSVHFFYILILLLNTFLIFKIVEKISNRETAHWSLILYPALNTLFYPVDIHKGPEFVVVLLLLLAWFFLIYFTSFFYMILSSFFIGLSLFFKQFGLILIIGFSFLVYYYTKNFKKSFFYFISGITPFILFLFYLYKRGLFSDWIIWNIKYPLFLASHIPLWKKIYSVFPMVFRALFLNPFLLIFSIFFLREKKGRNDFLLILFITFLWGAIHGLPFPHHYILFFTVMIIISIIGFTIFLSKKFYGEKIIFNTILIFSILQSIFYWHGFDYYKKWINFLKNKEWTKDYEVKKYEGIVKFIIENTEKDEKIIVWPFNPKIYLLTNREPGTRFIILDPVIGQTFANFTKIFQYQLAEKFFIEDIEINNVRLFIDATDNSLINMSFFKLEKYPNILKVLEEKFVFEKEINGFKVYRRVK